MRAPIVPSDLPINLQLYLRDFSTGLQQEFTRYVPKDVGVASILLVSPNGSVYSVAVADDGTLNTTAVQTP